jgi:hypothetical protein
MLRCCCRNTVYHYNIKERNFMDETRENMKQIGLGMNFTILLLSCIKITFSLSASMTVHVQDSELNSCYVFFFSPS